MAIAGRPSGLIPYTPPASLFPYTPPSGLPGGAVRATPKAPQVTVAKPKGNLFAPVPAKKAIPTPTSTATQAPPAPAPPRTKQPVLSGSFTLPSLITVKGHTRAKPGSRKTTAVDQNPMPGATAADYSGVLSPSALAAEAAKMVTAQQLPATQQLNNESSASAAAALASAQTTQGYYKALAGILQNIAPGVQAGYDTAGANDAAFGKGFSDGLAHVQSQTQDEANNVLGVSGGGVQSGQVTGQIGGTNATDALYNLGGYLPATTLESQGAAAGAAAKQLPFTAAGQGADAIKGINAQQVLDQKAISQKLDDLKAQVPGLAATTTHQLSTENLAMRQAADLKASRTDATALQRWVAQKSQGDKMLALKIQSIVATGRDANGNLTPVARARMASALGYDPVTGTPTATSANTTSRTAADWTRTNHYLSNADGSPVSGPHGYPIPQVGYKLTPSGTIVKAPTVRAPKTMTDSQWNTAYGKMNALIDGFYHSVPAITNSQGQVTHPAQPALSYQDAFRRIKAQWPKVTDSKLYEMLNLYFQPGEAGRSISASPSDGNPDTSVAGPPAPAPA